MNFTIETEFISCQEITICLFKTFAFASTSPSLKLDLVKELSNNEFFMSIIHEWQGGARRRGNTYATTLGFKKVIGEIGHCKDDNELNEAIQGGLGAVRFSPFPAAPLFQTLKTK